MQPCILPSINHDQLPQPQSLISHLHSTSFHLGMIRAHKGPSSPAGETINPGLMSNTGETTASKREINNSPARVYTPSLTTRAQKPGHVHSKFDSLKVLYSCFVSCRSEWLWMQKWSLTLRTYRKHILQDAFRAHEEECVHVKICNYCTILGDKKRNDKWQINKQTIDSEKPTHV